MADNIAKLSVLISATATPMDAGIDGAIARVKDLGSAITATLGSALSPLTTFTSAVGTVLSGNIGKGINQGLEGLKGVPPVAQLAVDALGAIPGPVGMIGKALGQVVLPALVAVKDATLGWAQAFVEAGERGMARIREMSRMARQFGTSLTGAAGLQLLAGQTGQDAGDLSRGFFQLNRGLASARAGSVEAQLAFERMGVTMDMIDRGDNAAVLERLRHFTMTNADAQQTQLLLSQAITRRGATSLMPILTQQAGTLEEMELRAVRFGLAVSDAEAKAVKGANLARQRMAADWNALFQGLENRIGVALAPVWQGIAEGFDRAVNAAQPAFASLRNVIGAAGVALSQVTAGFNAGMDHFLPLLDSAVRAFREIGDVVAFILTGSDGVSADWSQIGAFISQYVVTGLRQAALIALDIAETGISIWEAFRGVVSAIDAVVNGLRQAYRDARHLAVGIVPAGPAREALESQLLPANNGVSDLAGQLRDLAEAQERIRAARVNLLTGPLRSVAEIRAEQAILQRVEEAIALANRAQNVRATPGPMITASMLQSAINDASRAPALPQAMAAGTTSAVNLINETQRQTANPIQRMADNVMAQLEQQRIQSQTLRDLLDELRRRGVQIEALDLGAGG